ncbi:MAG: hypothetical protein COB85_08610 [Bacteroidetes bacterium]|nr:MAG: hypothetical protein COB85_08610 [Bacteroidota bacterium]
MRVYLLIIALMIAISGYAQKRTSEVGLFGGVSYYLGDLNVNRHFHLSQPAMGIVHRYIFSPHFALKNSFYYGTIAGDDAKSGDALQMKRNLHFKSSILDISVQLEFNFFPFDESKTDRVVSREEKWYFSPYVFIGLSLFSFNPKAEYNGTWFELQPLGTEGQGTIAYPDKQKYSLTQLAIPIGGGIKYDISKKVNIALEWGIRKTFTDYIDDVSTTYANPTAIGAEKGNVARQLSDRSIDSNTSSNVDRQRGNSKNKDLYAFAGLMITFKIINKYEEQKCFQ